MKRNTWMAGLGGLLAVSLAAVPAMAEKEAILDEELDRISAAGQPVAINQSAFGDVDVLFFPETNVIGGLQDQAQESLRALVLNNVVGENQVANGVNVTGGGTSQPQENTVTQSWGAVTDRDVVTVEGAHAGGGKRIGVFEPIGLSPAASENNLASSSCGFFIGICKPEAGTPDRAVLLSKYGDQVIENFSFDGQAIVEYGPFAVFVQELGDDAQTNLAALVVNNVVGMNQVANGVNIASGNLTVDNPLAFVSTGQTAAGQANTLDQFRGAPAGWSTRDFVQ